MNILYNTFNYIKYPFIYNNLPKTTTIVNKLKIDLSQLPSHIKHIYDIIINNQIFVNKHNINNLIYSLAKLYSDKYIYSYSYSIYKICNIIYDNYIGNKFITIYDYDENKGYQLMTYNSSGDVVHTHQINNSITKIIGHVNLYIFKNIWKKFDTYYEAMYPLYNKIFVHCLDNPFIDLKKGINPRIIIIYLCQKKIDK
jgi:hypothetical protein